MTSRFDYVKYDGQGEATQQQAKVAAQSLEGVINSLGNGRAKSLAFTKLEECYMWIGKQIRDDILAAGRPAPLMEERKNG